MLNETNKEKLVERFIKYVKINTKSDDDSKTVPSTLCQLDLAKVLVEELKAMGIEDVNVDSNGYVMATIPANTEKQGPVIGLIAHMDTSPDFSGENVKPKIIKNYDGLDISLNSDIVLSPSDYPELKNYIGQDLITTDGTTLLGADNKAGIAEIMTLASILTNGPDFEHGVVKIGFTPDEEVGMGADHFDVDKFNADYAYTVDGGEIGELEYENFNAASAIIKVQGSNIHPGTAKNKMKNATHMAFELNQLLPSQERPEHTEKYEGFYHLIHIEGTVEKAAVKYIIRDHDKTNFENRKETMVRNVEFLNKKYGEKTFELELKDSYYNMKEKIEPVMYIVDRACAAMEAVGVEPKIKAIRGGTDGARLSFMGLPTPNIFTGGHNYHGKFEYIPIQSMEKAVETIIEIVKIK